MVFDKAKVTDKATTIPKKSSFFVPDWMTPCGFVHRFSSICTILEDGLGCFEALFYHI